MKGLRAFLCRHPYLAILLPFIPCVLVAAGLVYYKMIDPSIALIALVWLFFLLSLPVRRIPHAVMREAALALERDLDPDAYLFHLDLLRARHLKNPVARISLGANYAAGLDAKGEYEAALAELRTLARDLKTLDVVNGVQFDLSYAVVAVHSEEGREEIPAVLSSIREVIPTLPPALAAAVRPKRMPSAIYHAAISTAHTYFFILTLMVLVVGGLMSVCGTELHSIKITMFWLSGAIYTLFLLRKLQIFSSYCNLFVSFLYLCALEILPTGVLITSAVIF
jgi:hypothetical protein